MAFDRHSAYLQTRHCRARAARGAHLWRGLISARMNELTRPNHPYQKGVLEVIKALRNQPVK
jgi:hypothetical protein